MNLVPYAAGYRTPPYARRLTLQGAGHAPETRTIELRAVDTIDLGDAQLQKTLQVPVVVTVRGDAQVPASMLVSAADPRRRHIFSGQITVDPNGRGVLTGLPAGTFEATLFPDGWAPFKVELTLREGMTEPLPIQLPLR